MDLLPTGSEYKIFEVKTNVLNVIVKNKKAHPVFIDKGQENPDSTIVFSGVDIKEIRLKGTENALPLDHDSPSRSIGFRTVPLFYEQNDYEIIIKGIGDDKVGFWHENYNVREKVETISEGENILTGIINFDNQIGYSDLIITSNEKTSLVIRIEVFPSKISYKEDYKNIITDIANEMYSVVFDFLRKTYQASKLSDHVEDTPAIFFTIFRTIFTRFIKAADLVIMKPHHNLIREHNILPSHKVRKTDHLTKKWLYKHPENIGRTTAGLSVSKLLMSIKI